MGITGIQKTGNWSPYLKWLLVLLLVRSLMEVLRGELKNKT